MKGEVPMIMKRLLSLAMLTAMAFGMVTATQTAQAAYYDRQGHYHSGHRTYYYDQRRHGWFDYKTGKILKGGLIGAGIGAGAGLLLDRNVGKSALVGAGLGAGTQAVRYSSTMRRHPILKTATYGALAGTGVSAATGKRLAPGAVIGGALGAGVGALKNY